MTRRAIAYGLLLASVVLLGAHPSSAQQASEPARVGILGFGPPLPPSPTGVVATFLKSMADLGYLEGKNLIVEERWQPPDKKEWLPDAIAELERAKVNAFFAFGAVPARVLKAVGTTTPTVFVAVVATRELVSNPDKPEGSMTGFTIYNPKLPGEQLELLRQIVPNANRIAVLGDGSLPPIVFKPYEDTAQAMGLEPLILKISAPQPDFDGAFATMQREQADALVVLPHPIIAAHRRTAGEYAAKFRLPSLFGAGFANAGGLLTHGTEFNESVKPAAEYVDRILKGAKPGELPVQTVIRNKLIVNLKTAEALSVEVPAEVLKAAVEIIR